MKRREPSDRNSNVSSTSVKSSPGATSLYCLRPEDKDRIAAKINRLVDEGKFQEAAKIIVAVAFCNVDQEQLMNEIFAAVKHFKSRGTAKHAQ